MFGRALLKPQAIGMLIAWEHNRIWEQASETQFSFSDDQ